MNLAPRIINNQLHPFVSSAYIREDFARDTRKPVKVLVLHSQPKSLLPASGERDRLYADFLANLDLIFENAKRQGDKFDRVDIKLH